MKKNETVKEQFADVFLPGTAYDGSYHTPQAEAAEDAFHRLTDNRLVWTQVHGDVKSAVKAAMFQPYPYWPKLYECARDIIEQHRRLKTYYAGDITCAKLMGDTMALMRERYGLNVPRWWLPIMNKLRGR